MLIRPAHKPKMALPKTKIKEVTSTTRLRWVFSLIAGLFLLVLVAGWYRYTNKQADFDKAGESRLLKTVKEPALRGAIVDRNGTILAVSRYLRVPTFSARAIYEPKGSKVRLPDGSEKKWSSFTANELLEFAQWDKQQAQPQVNWNKISDKQFEQLAHILNLPEEEVRAKFADVSKQYIKFEVKLSLEEADALKALNIPSLTFENRTERVYPANNLFAHLVGVANSKGEGLDGIELSRNQDLKGTEGLRVYIEDASKNIVGVRDDLSVLAKSGQTLELTVDYTIQKLVHDELAAAIKHFNAKAGAVVVLDAKTGDILAMSSLPDFDANHYGLYPEENKMNFAVGATMEPGSIMKPFVVAKAIDDGKVAPNTMFNTRPYAIGSKTIRDTHDYPSLTTQGILQKSSNVGTSLIAAKYSNQELYDFFSAVGLGKKTGSGVTGEQSSKLKPANSWGKLDKAVMSYGYSITANLLQMAQGYTIFTADGKLMKAHISKSNEADQGVQVIKPESARIMRQMMVSITEKGGTGRAGAVEGYRVAAKTGTAKKTRYDARLRKSYYVDQYRASFVGFAPADNPRLIVAVTIDEPRGNGYYGGTVAGPVFRNVMAGSLKYLKVQPDQTYANR